MPLPARRKDPTAGSARKLWRAAAALLAVVAVSGPARAAELTISAAASLSNAFRDIGAAFEQVSPGTTVRLNAAASGQLLQQIASGAPVDVFASADAETMDRAEQQRLVVAGSRVDVARNALVVIVPADVEAAPRRLADLAGDAFKRIAIGVPASVPVGRYAKAALERARLWPALEAKMVGAQSVRQVLDYVARGEVDAGFVYATDARLMADKVRVAFVVATVSPVLYPMARIATSRQAALAQRFIDYVGSPPGQAVLARHGFLPP